MLNSNELYDLFEELVNHYEEIEGHLFQAREIIEQLASDERFGSLEQRSKAYWYAQIAMALNDQHTYLGTGTFTMKDAVDRVESVVNGDDEDDQ